MGTGPEGSFISRILRGPAYAPEGTRTAGGDEAVPSPANALTIQDRESITAAHAQFPDLAKEKGMPAAAKELGATLNNAAREGFFQDLMQYGALTPGDLGRDNVSAAGAAGAATGPDEDGPEIPKPVDAQQASHIAEVAQLFERSGKKAAVRLMRNILSRPGMTREVGEQIITGLLERDSKMDFSNLRNSLPPSRDAGAAAPAAGETIVPAAPVELPDVSAPTPDNAPSAAADNAVLDAMLSGTEPAGAPPAAPQERIDATEVVTAPVVPAAPATPKADVETAGIRSKTELDRLFRKSVGSVGGEAFWKTPNGNAVLFVPGEIGAMQVSEGGVLKFRDKADAIGPAYRYAGGAFTEMTAEEYAIYKNGVESNSRRRTTAAEAPAPNAAPESAESLDDSEELRQQAYDQFMRLRAKPQAPNRVDAFKESVRKLKPEGRRSVWQRLVNDGYITGDLATADGVREGVLNDLISEDRLAARASEAVAPTPVRPSEIVSAPSTEGFITSKRAEEIFQARYAKTKNVGDAYIEATARVAPAVLGTVVEKLKKLDGIDLGALELAIREDTRLKDGVVVASTPEAAPRTEAPAPRMSAAERARAAEQRAFQERVAKHLRELDQRIPSRAGATPTPEVSPRAEAPAPQVSEAERARQAEERAFQERFDRHMRELDQRIP